MYTGMVRFGFSGRPIEPSQLRGPNLWEGDFRAGGRRPLHARLERVSAAVYSAVAF